MIKQLLAKNKIVQRVKAVKDLFLEKLDSLSHVQLEQIQKLEKLNQLDPLDFKVEQLNNSTEKIRQENAETKRKADLSLENQAFLLKFSVDIIKNIQVLTEKLQTNHSQSQKQQELTLDTFQKIRSRKFIKILNNNSKLFIRRSRKFIKILNNNSKLFIKLFKHFKRKL